MVLWRVRHNVFLDSNIKTFCRLICGGEKAQSRFPYKRKILTLKTTVIYPGNKVFV